TVKTKDGFNHEGVDAEVLTGSYGRKQLQVSGGWNNGTIGLFGAGNFFLEDGWRDNSPSRVNQAFGKASYRGDKLDLSLSTLLVKTELVGNGLLPSEMYAQDRSSVYSSPDTTENTLGQFQLSGSYFVNDTFTITGQVYRRDSKRHAVGADVFTDYDEELLARRIPADGEQYTCLLDDLNSDGIPDYYVLTIENPSDGFDSDLFGNTFFLDALGAPGGEGNPALLLAEQPDAFNKELPPEVAQYFQTAFNQQKNYVQSVLIDRRDIRATPGQITDYSFDQPSYQIADFTSNIIKAGVGNNAVAIGQVFENWYYTVDENNVVSKNYVMFVSPNNNDNCTATQSLDVAQDAPAFSQPDPDGGPLPATVDGFSTGQRGIVEGTPTAVFTDNQINQIVDGASIQFNWSLPKHKFMIGASIDASRAEYLNTQQLGFLDANRNAYLAP
ncbi:MAG: TonB-dependent receptor, partial [Nitrosomonadales bacterium]|nr:TonB-dependent receptor [Nitrosomonadales bacterium]